MLQGEEIREAMREGVQAFRDVDPEARIEWLPCGHNVPMKCPAELADLIVGFTQRKDRSPA